METWKSNDTILKFWGSKVQVEGDNNATTDLAEFGKCLARFQRVKSTFENLDCFHYTPKGIIRHLMQTEHAFELYCFTKIKESVALLRTSEQESDHQHSKFWILKTSKNKSQKPTTIWFSKTMRVQDNERGYL